MYRHLLTATATVSLAVISCVAMAAGPRFPSGNRGNPLQSRSAGELPRLECSRTHCRLVDSSTQGVRAHTLATTAASPAAASPTPVVVGPPAGQRFLWQGAGYPTCQSLVGTPYSISNPYPYIQGNQIPVPLGSTHISLWATVEVNLSGGPAGAGALVGFLQVKRSSGSTWVMADAGYAFSIPGSPNSTSLYNTSTFQGLVNLADLPDGTGVPSEIDARLAVFPVYSGDGGFSNVIYNSVCWGQMQLSF